MVIVKFPTAAQTFTFTRHHCVNTRALWLQGVCVCVFVCLCLLVCVFLSRRGRANHHASGYCWSSLYCMCAYSMSIQSGADNRIMAALTEIPLPIEEAVQGAVLHASKTDSRFAKKRWSWSNKRIRAIQSVQEAYTKPSICNKQAALHSLYSSVKMVFTPFAKLGKCTHCRYNTHTHTNSSHLPFVLFCLHYL